MKTPVQSPPSMLEQAISYSQRGWPVFPLKARGKLPLTMRGFKDASADERTIRAWWSRWPDANIGLPTGEISGLAVIDIDPRHGGEESLDWITGQHGPLPDTACVLTGGGGKHFYFKYVPGFRNSASQIAKGIDTRGEGGYVVAPCSTHESGRTYEWESGDDSEIVLADLPAWLVPGTSVQPQISAGNLTFVPGPPKANGQPVEPGGRNNAAASLAGQFVTAGDSLTEVVRKLRAWNTENPTPLSDIEIEKTAASVARTHVTKNPGAVLNVGDVPPVVLEAKTEQLPEAAKIFPSVLLEPPGKVGDLCKWINDTAIKPQPVLSLANVLAFYGAVVGRKVRTPTDLRTNLYCLGVGASGCGKDHSRKSIKKVCEAAGITTSILGGEDVSSDAAVFSAVFAHPSILFQLDEIGHFLANANSKYAASHQKNIAPTFTKLFSSANTTLIGKEYVGRVRTDVVQPNVCLYGTTVAERLYEGLTPNEISDGFLGRMLVFRSDENDPIEEDHLVLQDAPEFVVQDVLAWFQRNDLPRAEGNIAAATIHMPHIIRFEPDAFAELARFRLACRTNKAASQGQIGLDALWSRAVEHAAKIALVVSCGCEFQTPIVNGQTMAWAIALVDHLVRALVETVGESIAGSEFERDLLYVKRALRTAGIGGLSQSQLIRRTQRLTPRIRTEILNQLISSSEVEKKQVKPTRGPVAAVFCLTKQLFK